MTSYFTEQRRKRLEWLNNYMTMVVEDPINKNGLGYSKVIDMYQIRYGLSDHGAKADIDLIIRNLEYENIKGIILRKPKEEKVMPKEEKV